MCEIRDEPFQALAPAFFHASEVDLGSGFFHLHLGMEDDGGFAAVLSEGDSVEHLEHRLLVRAEGRAREHDAFRFYDLLELAGHGIDGPVRPLHVDVDRAAGAGIHLAHRIAEALRSPPPGKVDGVDPHLEHQRPRRGEDAGEEQFSFQGLSHKLCGLMSRERGDVGLELIPRAAETIAHAIVAFLVRLALAG